MLTEPGRPLWIYLVCAALCGLGGGNFASSMTNINAFFPQRLKGWALGINAGGRNIGVPAVQVVGLLVIAIAGNLLDGGYAGINSTYQRACAHREVVKAAVQRGSPRTR